MRRSRQIAFSGMFSALAAVLLWIGALSGLGTYAAPLAAGIALTPVGMTLGKRYQWLSFAAVALLSCLISADWEQNLMFSCLFGWYPIVQPALNKLKKLLRFCTKLLIFNLITIGIELLIMLVLIPQSEKTLILITLLVLGNLMFLVYDSALPRMEFVLARRLKLK